MRKIAARDAQDAKMAIQSTPKRIFERWIIPFHLVFQVIFFIVLSAGAYFFTIEADEAWMLMSTMHAFGKMVSQTTALANPTITTGGIYFIIHGLISLISANIIAHRAVSVFFSFAAVWVVSRILKSLDINLKYRFAGISLFTGIPFFILQGSLATGEIIATTLLIAALVHFCFYGRNSTRGAVISGLLLGLSCATRISLAFAIFVPSMFVLIGYRDSQGQIARSILTTIVAGLVFAGCVGLYLFMGDARHLTEQLPYLSHATGVGQGHEAGGRLLQHLIIANGILPLVLVAVIAGSWYLSLMKQTYPKAIPICGIFLLSGILGWSAWLLFAPIPHVRYLWPALACLWLAGTIQLIAFAAATRRFEVEVTVHIIAAVCCSYAIASSFLLVSRGESLVLVYQMMGGSPFVLTGEKFRASRDQAALSNFVRSRSRKAQFFTFFEPPAYPITYLSGRNIPSVEHMQRGGENYVILVPADYSIWRPESDFAQWRKANTDTVFSRGGFIALRVRSDAAKPPTRFSGAGDYDHFE